jgi:protein MpaA
METERLKRGTISHFSEVFGTSVSGIPLRVYLPKSGAPELLVIAAQHGDEPETNIVLSHALRTINQDGLSAAVVLCANPDGMLQGTRGNERGVDLNRNFPTATWSTDPVAYRWSSEHPRDVELGTGGKPGSEPETIALLGLLDRLKPKLVVSLHAPLGCIDDPESSEMAKYLAETTSLKLVTDIGYSTPGSFGTWAGENELPLITFELPHASLEDLRRKFEPVIIELLSKGLSAGK